MRTHIYRLLVSIAPVFIAGLAAVRPISAQSTACLQPDSAVTAIDSALVNLATTSDTAAVRIRAALNLPGVAASEVQLITDSTTCASAAVALAQVTTGGDPAQGAWVFRFGPTRFIAFNGHQSAHGSPYLVIFDQTFVKLGSFPI